MLRGRRPPAAPLTIPNPFQWPPRANWRRRAYTAAFSREDLWGGYLIYREYPRGRVFIDGRSDFYGAEFARKYMKAMGAQAGWERYLSRYGVETVLLPPDAPLAGALKAIERLASGL